MDIHIHFKMDLLGDSIARSAVTEISDKIYFVGSTNDFLLLLLFFK